MTGRNEGEGANENSGKQTSKQVQVHVALTYIPSLITSGWLLKMHSDISPCE